MSMRDLACLVGRVRMNAVEAIVPIPDDVNLDEGLQLQAAEGLALHLVASSVNHACDPNAALQSALPLPEIRGWAVLQVLKPIKQGDEVTIEYIAASTDRQKQLLEQWHIQCSCGNCSSSE
eukprot:TRINITY_DN27109_c0_g1_i1.p1 TRINITY_DN27109_c0_g1~~TRINITY_DN27109_c0_g1_i1.p1  ORF type:complete len:121 (-),score=18.38 TRINITY_DN27109_c0_g1_i1:130-492(-)